MSRPDDQNNQSEDTTGSATLRQRAEAVLQGATINLEDISVEEVQRLIQELRVHQVELSIQNEELRQAQEEIKVSRDAYIDLYDFAPVGYLTIVNEQIVEANLTAATLLGVERSALLQQPVTHFILPEDQDTYYFHSRRLTESQALQINRLRLRRGSSFFHARIESSVIVQHGRTAGYRMSIIDVSEQVAAEEALRAAHAHLEQRVAERTAELDAANHTLQDEIIERQRTEEALRQSEAGFRLVLQDSAVVVFAQDRDLRYTAIHNPTWYSSEQDFLGKTDDEMISPEEAAPLIAIKRRVLETGQSMREEIALNLDGQTRWYDLKIEPQYDPDGSINGIIGAATDVTMYRRAMNIERLLADASEPLTRSLDPDERLRSLAHLIVSTIADICSIDTLGDNGRLIPTTAVSPDIAATGPEYRWTEPYAVDFTSSHLVARVLHSRQPLLLEPVQDADLQTIARDEEHLAYLRNLHITAYVGVPLTVQTQPVGVLSLFTTGTHRHYDPHTLSIAEELGRRAALALDNARLYAAEQQNRAEAEDAVRIRDHMFRLISHDLKSPLATIRGYTQLLRRRISTQDIADSERIMRGLKNIEAATMRMIRQAQELLDLASLQAGQPLALTLEPIDLIALVRQVVDDSRQLSEQHSLQMQITPARLTCAGDIARLERVLTNLLSNAMKYSPAGSSVFVTVSREEQSDTDRAVVTVRDQGIGIPAEDLPRLFQPFQRGSNVVRAFSGTGLGLASTRQIIEQHGGAISVTSEEDMGTTVTFWLPLQEEA
ncbi:MAG: ATP-binding protein [Chloroflexaceae bacterium]